MTEEKLNEVRELREKLRAALSQVRALRESLINLTVELDGMPHAHSNRSRVEQMALLIVEGEREVDAIQAKIDATGAALAREIKNSPLSSQEKEIFILRYVGCVAFREIKAKLHLSEQRLFYLHRNALKKLK